MNTIKLAMADDHALLRNALASLINSFDNCKVIYEAGNGKELITKMQQHPIPDVVLLDLSMPVMNGFDFLAEREKDERLKNIPVVIFSTTSDLGTVKKTYEMGANVFFKKPNDFPTLRTKLHGLLEKPDPVSTPPGSAFSFAEYFL